MQARTGIVHSKYNDYICTHVLNYKIFQIVTQAIWLMRSTDCEFGFY